MSKNYYGIRKGRTIGVFEGEWKEIEEKIIKGYSNAVYKGFNDKLSAYEYVYGKPQKMTSIKQRKSAGNIHDVLIYDKDNMDHRKKKSLILTIVGHQKPLEQNKPGYFEYFLENIEEASVDRHVSNVEYNLTANAAVLKGVIMAVKNLSTPSHILVYSKAPLGISKMLNGGASPNRVLLNDLKKVLLDGEHVIEGKVDKEKVENKVGSKKNTESR